MDQAVLNILAEAIPSESRTETYLGKDFLVVPVIALVEGVLQSANADDPELALASEFGRYPNAWDGRPVVMNHPQVSGSYVSANSPNVLEEWSYGQLFNTRISGQKLKTEAWIDISKVNEAGGEIQSTIERISNGEMVEISTGLFASVESLSGTYEGVDYKGVWRSVAPDHLAFLSEGSIGACSIEDGCGVPRLNILKRVSASSECNCGGACQSKRGTTVNIKAHTADEQLSKAQKRLDELSVNSYPSDMPIENVKMLLEIGLRKIGIDLYRIYTCTQDVVIYENWTSSSTFQRSYTIADDTTVTIGVDEVEVDLMTKIVPRVNSQHEDEDDENTRSSTEDDEELSNTQEGDSAVNSNTEHTETSEASADEVPVVTPNTEVVASEASAPEEVVAEETLEATPMTVNEYIAKAPEGIQEMLGESMRLHNDRKNKIVESLVANSRNEYTREELDAMSIRDLERMGKLANVPTYVGQAPTQLNQEGGTSYGAPKALEAFPVKAREAAA